MAKLSLSDIKHVATLSKLSLTDSELKKFGSQLSKVVDYISELSHVDTSGIESTSQTTGLTNVYRSDKTNAQETLSVEDATGGSENVHNNYFVVSSVLEKRGKK